MAHKVCVIGYGYVGRAYHSMFPGAAIYDEPLNLFVSEEHTEPATTKGKKPTKKQLKKWRSIVNSYDIAIVCVPTNLKEGELDMSIVEEVVGWLQTPLILIKSALQPGTVDRLVEATGKKIAVSVEMVGEGKYFIPYWKYPDPEAPITHSMIIVGGEEQTARRCADVLWSRMSPEVDIHLVSAVEAEITKLMENTWGAMKVTFANAIYDICEKYGANYTRVLQAWGADGRVEKMHMRVVPGKRGWKSKCYDKDVVALAKLDDSGFIKAVVKANDQHLAEN